MILPKGAIVAVVDGENLVLFRNTGHNEPHLTPVATPSVHDGGSGSGGHHSSSANPDNDTQAEDAFAHGVANLLNQWAVSGKLDDLVVIAAPRTLGELRKRWHKQLEGKLVAEIAKDLTGASAAQIVAAIDKA
jgi:protein required for attachment to host cells